MPEPREVREIGRVADIDGFDITLCTEGGRVRIETGTDLIVLDAQASEEFARLFVSAFWQAAEQAGRMKDAWRDD
jgi:hypothetical protein